MHVFQSQARSQSTGDGRQLGDAQLSTKFQSQARSQSTGDGTNYTITVSLFVFQSQARSQSTGDPVQTEPYKPRMEVSISGEKPIHWRRLKMLTSQLQPM